MNAIGNIPLAMLLSCFVAVECRADPFQTYCEIRPLDSLGQIVVSAGTVDMKILRPSATIRDSLLPGSTDLLKLERNMRLGSYKIRVVLELQPPTGTGPGGGLSMAWMTVYSNGRKKIDLPCGWLSQNPMQVWKVTLHRTGFIDITAFADEKVLEAPLSTLWLDSKDLIDMETLKPSEGPPTH